MKIPIQQIQLTFRQPDQLDEMTVEQYAKVLRSGGTTQPVSVYSDGRQYWLADGFHRIEAARIVGLENIEVEVTPGTYEDLEAHWQRYLAELRKNLSGEK